MNECNCSLTDKSSCDGCRVCNPQEMIDLLLEHIAELEQCISKLEAPKNCEDCTSYNTNYSGCYKCLWQIQQDGSVKEDYYEPKEQK